MKSLLISLFLGFLVNMAASERANVLHMDDVPSSLPTAQSKYVQEQYEQFMKERNKNKEQARKRSSSQTQKQQPQPKKPPGPHKLGQKRTEGDDSAPLSVQHLIEGGEFWYGTQMGIAGKLLPSVLKDGASPLKHASVNDFLIDEDCVSNFQFKDFIRQTGYQTEAELFGWSFLLDFQASEDVIEEVDGPMGYGRVKDALHWMAAKGTSWNHPYGSDSYLNNTIMNFPVVHVSFNDAWEYCHWAGRRLPTSKEWEYAARSGRVNQTYPWGSSFKPSQFNIWQGKFPKENLLEDGYGGLAPLKSFPPNDYGLYNMLGNVWEWVQTKQNDQRILRGGSFIDSLDGSFNHLVSVSTMQTNSPDSTASNIGFRCASSVKSKSERMEL